VEIAIVITLKTSLIQHATETSFLWEARRTAVDSSNYSISDLNKLDRRIEAHLDGLRIAGEDGWEICKEELRWKGPGEVFAAAVLALEGGNRDWIAEVVKIGTAEPEAVRGLISALGWLPFCDAEPHIRRLGSQDLPDSIRVAVAALAIHRHDPGSLLVEAIRAEEPLLRARGLKAAGELGRGDLCSHAVANLNSDHPEVRFWAAWSLALLSGDETALSVLRSIAESDHPRREKALQLVMRRMPQGAARDWLRQLAGEAVHRRSACIGAGALGDPEMVPWLIEQMRSPPVARVAGEALTTITGVDLTLQDLEGRWPDGFQAGPTEDPKDENVEMDPDENLPWPDAGKIEAWWAKNGSEFQTGTRYLLGRPLSIDWLQTVLREGRQRQRAAAALELAIRQPGQPLFEVRAPGFRQQEMLR
jgi:uncharacterized protein (TIGR02270 family)